MLSVLHLHQPRVAKSKISHSDPLIYIFTKERKKERRRKNCPAAEIVHILNSPRLHKPLIFLSSAAPLEGSQVWAPSLEVSSNRFPVGSGRRRLRPLRQSQWLGSATLFSLTATKACRDPRSIKQPFNKPRLLAGHHTAAPSPTPGALSLALSVPPDDTSRP